MLRFVRQGKIKFVPIFIFIEDHHESFNNKILMCEDNDEINYWRIFNSIFITW